MSEHFKARSCDRVAIDVELPVRRSFAPRWTARMSNFSAAGCRVDTVERLQPHERMFVYLPGLETIESTARWTDGHSAGLEFARPLHPSVFALIETRLRT